MAKRKPRLRILGPVGSEDDFFMDGLSDADKEDYKILCDKLKDEELINITTEKIAEILHKSLNKDKDVIQ